MTSTCPSPCSSPCWYSTEAYKRFCVHAFEQRFDPIAFFSSPLAFGAGWTYQAATR